MRKKRQKSGKNSIVLISALAIVFVIFVAVVFRIRTNRINEQNALEQKQIAELESQLAAEQQRADEIDEYGKYVNTKQFIEDMARERLGLVYPDEVIFKTDTE